MYTVQASDASYLTGIPLWLVAPFETAVLISAIGGVVSLILWLVFVIRSKGRRTVLMFVALASGVAALLNGVVVLPALLDSNAPGAQASSEVPVAGEAFDRLFSAPQNASDSPSLALPTDVAPERVRSLGGLTETGQASIYAALSPSGQVCLIVYDELGAYAETCRSAEEASSTGLQVKLSGSFRLDDADNPSKSSMQSAATVTWNLDRGVSVYLVPQ